MMKPERHFLTRTRKGEFNMNTNMITWTCCECGRDFDYRTGDTDERMCDVCLGEEEDDE